jgi:hypothetical protein
MAPWIFLIFLGVFDFGFYAYALVATTNAARVGVLYSSQDFSTADKAGIPCAYVLEELRMLPNVGPSITCAGSGGSYTAGPNISVVANRTGAAGTYRAEIAVTYTTPQMFPIPGLKGIFTFTRRAFMKVQE